MALLQHVAAPATGTSTDYTRTLSAGGNRKAVVCVQQEGGTANTFTATLDGVPMVSMGGGFSGQVASAGNSQHLAWFALLEENLGEGDVTLNVTSSETEDNTSCHYFLLSDAAQTFQALAAAVDYEAGTDNPKAVTINGSSAAEFTCLAVAGCGNETNYTLTYDGQAPDSTQEVDNGATTTGASAVWEAQSVNGNAQVSASSSGTVNRSALAAMLVETIAAQVPGRQRREVVDKTAPSGIVLSDRYLETRLLSADFYRAVVTCDMNRQSVVVVERSVDGVAQGEDTLAFSPNEDVPQLIPFQTLEPNTVVRIGHQSVTGNTSSGVVMLFESEIQTASGGQPEEEGVV
jgi:hypothetical protein